MVQLHYDVTHNIYHHIAGNKTIILVPPVEMVSKACLHPEWHGHNRQSQAIVPTELGIEFQFIYAGEMPSYPCPTMRTMKYKLVHLKPGDTLYIPPYWGHMIINRSPTISYNIFWHSRMIRMEREL